MASGVAPAMFVGLEGHERGRGGGGGGGEEMGLQTPFHLLLLHAPFPLYSICLHPSHGKADPGGLEVCDAEC